MEWRHFVTYLWNEPRIMLFTMSSFTLYEQYLDDGHTQTLCFGLTGDVFWLLFWVYFSVYTSMYIKCRKTV